MANKNNDFNNWPGFLLGFFFSIIGVIIAIAIGDQPMKKSAVSGFCCSLIIGGLLGLFIYLPSTL